MVDYLTGLIGRVGQWGYLLIFAGAMLESAALIGLLVPGEALVLASGFFAAQGALDLDALIVCVAFGATLGDSLGYELGRHWGRQALLRHGRRFGVTLDRMERIDAFFQRHGAASVFLGRFVGFARALVPFLAGSARMPYGRFLANNAAGAVLWSVVIAVCVFGAIAEDVATHDPLTRFDVLLAQWLVAHRDEALTAFMLAVTHMHDTLPVVMTVVLASAVLLRRGEYRWLATLVAATAGGTLLNTLLKHAFQRARPEVDRLGQVLPTFSFPSGHVAAATLLYGFLAAYAVGHVKHDAWRAVALCAAAFMIVLVGVTRMYLGAHFLSDVLGAFAAAIAWLALCLMVFQGRLVCFRPDQRGRV